MSSSSAHEIKNIASKLEPRDIFERNNPCHKEHSLSLACLDEYFYDREKCSLFFKNYKNCKAFWNFVSKERRKKGIKPYVPVPEERAKVKAEYLPHFQPMF